LGADFDDPWAAFEASSPEAHLCTETARRLARPQAPAPIELVVSSDLGRTPTGQATTQAALGRTLLDLARAAPEVGARIVTISPDVSSSTNLGGWVNRVGVWSHAEGVDWFADDADTILHWREQPSGQHLELGIAETNLVGALSEFGSTWSRWGQPLIPIGVLYDPFVGRALEPWTFGIYAGGQSILVGTPSGVSLSHEGGAHQSITTPSIGLEQPGCVSWEPAFAIDTGWILLAAIAGVGRPGGTSAYVRLSTRPVDQELAAVPIERAAREQRRRLAVAGGYGLRYATSIPAVTLCAMGALVPEALAAAHELERLGFATDVVCVTSPGLLFRAGQARSGLDDGPDWILNAALPADRAAPMVTVLDGHPHTLAFLAGVNRVPAAHLGVTHFGQAGDIDSVYRYHQIDAASIVGVVLDLVD
jgi:pyruvate dehydrogenase E1 component